MELDTFTPGETEYPVYSIAHKTGRFEVSDKDWFNNATIIPLGVFQQRLAWPKEDSGLKMVPVCRSPNNMIGFRTNYGEQKTDLPEVGKCWECDYKEWNDGKQPCGKIYYIPFLFANELDGPIRVLKMNRSASKPIKDMFSKMSKRPPYCHTVLASLLAVERNGNRYSVPSFSKIKYTGEDTFSNRILYTRKFMAVKSEFEKLALPRPPASATLSPMSMGA